MASVNTCTIEEIKTTTSSHTLSSPRKSGIKIVKCAVLTKSNLRETKRGSMFTMTLSDRDPTSSIRAVCFDEKMFEKFLATKTYDLRYFKLKKGMAGDVEILITDETQVTESLVEFTIEKKSFKISQIISRETFNIRFFNLKAKVISIDDLQTVGKYPDQKQKRDIILGDESGQVTFVLWRHKAESVNFQEGDVINIENAVTTTFNNNVMVTTGGETKISVVNEEMKVGIPTGLGSPSKKHRSVTCAETNILAIKNFTCKYRCINCRKDIDWIGSSTSSSGNVVIKCPTCSTVFMGQITKVRNECQLMLSYNDNWFTASTGVIQHMFDWSSPKRQASDQDIENMLNSKFSVRLDLDRKIIEHAEVVNTCEESLQDDLGGCSKDKPQGKLPENQLTDVEEQMLLEISGTDGKSKVD